jgi:hypothetical protein
VIRPNRNARRFALALGLAVIALGAGATSALAAASYNFTLTHTHDPVHRNDERVEYVATIENVGTTTGGGTGTLELELPEGEGWFVYKTEDENKQGNWTCTEQPAIGAAPAKETCKRTFSLAAGASYKLLLPPFPIPALPTPSSPKRPSKGEAPSPHRRPKTNSPSPRRSPGISKTSSSKTPPTRPPKRPTPPPPAVTP